MAAVSALEKTDSIDARSVDFDSIPVIDVGPFFGGSDAAKAEVAA